MHLNLLPYLGILNCICQMVRNFCLSRKWRPTDHQLTRWSWLRRQKIRSRVLHKLLHCNGARQHIHLIQKPEPARSPIKTYSHIFQDNKKDQDLTEAHFSDINSNILKKSLQKQKGGTNCRKQLFYNLSA